MNTMQVLIEAIASRRIKPHQLLGQVNQGEPLTYAGQQVRYRKLKPGQYVVEVANEGTEDFAVSEQTETPVAAKLAVIDALTELATKKPTQQ